MKATFLQIILITLQKRARRGRTISCYSTLPEFFWEDESTTNLQLDGYFSKKTSLQCSLKMPAAVIIFFFFFSAFFILPSLSSEVAGGHALPFYKQQQQSRR
jgi:hypothetical protein